MIKRCFILSRGGTLPPGEMAASLLLLLLLLLVWLGMIASSII
jgi:hypothetical protein